MSIPFRQYLLPDGRTTEITVDRPAEVEAMAQVVIGAGLRFEAEMLRDYRTISLTVYDPTEEEDLGIEVVGNGPDVPPAVDRLVRDAHALVTSRVPT